MLAHLLRVLSPKPASREVQGKSNGWWEQTTSSGACAMSASLFPSYLLSAFPCRFASLVCFVVFDNTCDSASVLFVLFLLFNLCASFNLRIIMITATTQTCTHAHNLLDLRGEAHSVAAVVRVPPGPRLACARHQPRHAGHGPHAEHGGVGA